eukprot:CAMPEP_0185823106 /NCGR_PEP_ID=MMETSP1322-20130828/27699_1 /TAXON_ID=265543 /ORGANISM="Minutocellus polymorphus, Strain RCC2270" /LENGTH=61 /DNA_ID=CAMNT_0028520627 /DNA_START=81 /DNA_END=263 /DNA_ORIENTATION=+
MKWFAAATALLCLLLPLHLPLPVEGKEFAPSEATNDEDTLVQPTAESYYEKFAKAVGRKME